MLNLKTTTCVWTSVLFLCGFLSLAPRLAHAQTDEDQTDRVHESGDELRSDNNQASGFNGVKTGEKKKNLRPLKLTKPKEITKPPSPKSAAKSQTTIKANPQSSQDESELGNPHSLKSKAKYLDKTARRLAKEQEEYNRKAAELEATITKLRIQSSEIKKNLSSTPINPVKEAHQRFINKPGKQPDLGVPPKSLTSDPISERAIKKLVANSEKAKSPKKNIPPPPPKGADSSRANRAAVSANTVKDLEQRRSATSKSSNLLEQFLETLKLTPEEMNEYVLDRAFRKYAENIFEVMKSNQSLQEPPTLEGLLFDLALAKFSPNSASAVGNIYGATAKISYNNAMVLAEAGVGKTFLINQLVALYSFGVYPEYIESELGIGGPTFKKVHDALIGHTQVVIINASLLSRDSTKNGEPWAEPELRRIATLEGLFASAKAEFQRTRKLDGVGRRTLFILDEIATLPEDLSNSLKKLQDKGGFKDPANPTEAELDPGYMVTAMTTPAEYRQMVRGDSAIDRRYERVTLAEPTEQEAFEIILSEAKVLERTYGVSFDEDSLWTIIHMRKLFNSPPLAMPASVLAATNSIFTWKMKGRGDHNQHLSKSDAKRFIIERYHLTDRWFEGPQGEAPFWDLPQVLKAAVVDQDAVMDRIASRLQSWARMGFGSGNLLYFIGGVSGAGKNHFIKTISQYFFGHDGTDLTFNIGGAQGFTMESIFEGPPIGNHSDDMPPQVVQRMEGGNHNGFLVLDEGKDAPGAELAKLKPIAETGIIQPRGVDSRPRHLIFPMFILGQWGEEIFWDDDGKIISDEEIVRIRSSVTQKQMEDAFANGAQDGKTGQVPRALIDRANGKKGGGLYLLSPVRTSELPRIAQFQVDSIIADLKSRLGIDVQVDPSVIALISRHALETGVRTRAIEGLATSYVQDAISQAMNQGLKLDQAKSISISAPKGTSYGSLTIKSLGAKQSFTVWTDSVRMILMPDCGQTLSHPRKK